MCKISFSGISETAEGETEGHYILTPGGGDPLSFDPFELQSKHGTQHYWSRDVKIFLPSSRKTSQWG
jgi:hypothetical protein